MSSRVPGAFGSCLLFLTPLASLFLPPLVILASPRLPTPFAAIAPDVLRSSSAIPAHLAGRFREPIGFQQSGDGQYFIFDRRAHTVYGVDERKTSVWEIVTIGAEEGRIIDPTAFAVEPGGTFVVADAPNNRERLQIFTAAGFRVGGFMLPGHQAPRVTVDNAVLNGIGSLQYTGTSILMSQPETGALIAEYTPHGTVNRLIGALRRTGHESEYDLHVALNCGIPLVDPRGDLYFVFQSGEPMFRKYDHSGALVFERRIEGREVDPLIAALPTTWPVRRSAEGELPLVSPMIRAAAVDSAGNLWVSFVAPYTYVYDGDGDKIRTLQLSAAGVVSPNSLFFGKNRRLLVTPGLVEFPVP
jgi:hypothetical protein